MLQDLIKERLAFLEPSHLSLKDLSDLHKGHSGNTGGGHFNLDWGQGHIRWAPQNGAQR